MPKLFLLALLLAPRVIPETYTIEISREELSEIASPTFCTHTTKRGALVHWVTENVVFLPLWAFIHAQAYFEQPFPGEEKERTRWEVCARKSCAAIGSVFTFMPACHSLLMGVVLRSIEHADRPFLNYLNTALVEPALTLTEDEPLHIASHNVSFTPSSVNIKMDLRPCEERACELAESILNDPDAPSILMIEEGWNEGALKIFCEKMSHKYGHILHTIAPQIYGMSSGIAVFSRFAIEDVKYVRFEKMPLPHNFPSRGFLRVHYETQSGPLYIYGGIHTQSMPDYISVEARKHQLKQIRELVTKDAKEHPTCLQVIMGDMNTSPVDIYGHDNVDQPEGKVWRQLNRDFRDLFTHDHDAQTGKRTTGEPYFLPKDNARMNVTLPEPEASWYDGPFTRDPEKKLTLQAMREDRKEHGYPLPTLKPGKGIPPNPTWGTSRWYNNQSALNLRLDMILVPHNGRLTGRAEIRRIVMPKGAESAASDHLPVQARIWLMGN